MSYMVLPDGTIETLGRIIESAKKDEKHVPTLLEIVDVSRSIVSEFRN